MATEFNRPGGGTEFVVDKDLASENTLSEVLKQLAGSIKVQTKVVSCPVFPIDVPGITAANTFAASDTFGTLIKLEVPESGIICSATFWDFDDEKTQVDFEVFKHAITQTASEDAWSPTDEDMKHFVTELSFVSYDDHINSATFELTNIGKAYTAPEGFLWLQGVCRSTPTIAAGSMPKIQLQILSDDPNWQER